MTVSEAASEIGRGCEASSNQMFVAPRDLEALRFPLGFLTAE
jgi:hypothetical protein